MMDHSGLIRFQAYFFNILNLTNLTPLAFGSPETTISKYRALHLFL